MFKIFMILFFAVLTNALEKMDKFGEHKVVSDVIDNLPENIVQVIVP
jgi:hypothetical protein